MRTMTKFTPSCIEKSSRFKLNKTSNQFTNIGTVIDAEVKQKMQELGGIPSSYRFAPYDVAFGDDFVEIKSFARSSVSISEAELQFALKANEDGKKYFIAVFKQFDVEYEYCGSVEICEVAHLLEPSKHNDQSYFWWVSSLIPELK